MAFVCSPLRSFHMILLFIHVISVVRVRDSSIRQFDRRTRIHHTNRSTTHRERETWQASWATGQPIAQMEKKTKNVDEILSSVLVANYLRCVCVQSFRVIFIKRNGFLYFSGPFIRFVCKTDQNLTECARERRRQHFIDSNCRIADDASSSGRCAYICVCECVRMCLYGDVSGRVQSRRLTGTFESISATITTID